MTVCVVGLAWKTVAVVVTGDAACVVVTVTVSTELEATRLLELVVVFDIAVDKALDIAVDAAVDVAVEIAVGIAVDTAVDKADDVVLEATLIAEDAINVVEAPLVAVTSVEFLAALVVALVNEVVFDKDVVWIDEVDVVADTEAEAPVSLTP